MWKRRVRRLAPLVVLAAAPTVLGACVDQPIQGNSAITTVASPAKSVVDVRHVAGYGKILVTKSGKSLYMFTKDPPSTSDCTGYCVQAWPPLVVKGAVEAGPGADAKLLSTSQRSGGANQVFYAKHALYTYIGDARPGMTTGEGIKTYGGTWWLMSPAGKPVTKSSAPATKSGH